MYRAAELQSEFQPSHLLTHTHTHTPMYSVFVFISVAFYGSCHFVCVCTCAVMMFCPVKEETFQLGRTQVTMAAMRPRIPKPTHTICIPADPIL